MIHFSPVEHHIENRAHARLCDGRPASDADTHQGTGMACATPVRTQRSAKTARIG